MRAPGLSQAKRLYRAGKFRDVLRLLEPQIFRYRSDAVFYTLVGMSCLHTGEIGGAATYLGRAHQLDDRSTEVLLGLAAVHLRRNQPDEAVSCWLRVLDLDPRDRTALRGLEHLRAGGTPDERRVRALIPRPRRPLLRPLLIGLALTVAAGGAAFGVVRVVEAARAGAGRAARPGVQAVVLPTDRPEMVDATATAQVMFTERELVRAFNRARRYLLDYRDNLAVHELDRILLSNATAAVKEKATLLKGFAVPPDFRTYRDPFPYRVVAERPEEYADCYVRWPGKVANTVVTQERITFDLLVGYQEGRVLEGVVPVSLTFSAAIADGDAYEVLGRVVPLGAEGLALEAVSIRPLEGSR